MFIKRLTNTRISVWKKGKQMTIISHCASHFMWLSNNEPAYGGQCQLSSLYNSSLICLSLTVAHIHHQQEHDVVKSLLWKADQSNAGDPRAVFFSPGPGVTLPARFRRFPLLQHTWFKLTAQYQALLKPENDPFIWVRCACMCMCDSVRVWQFSSPRFKMYVCIWMYSSSRGQWWQEQKRNTRASKSRVGLMGWSGTNLYPGE